MQLIERVRDTEFLGREFLLWLWYNSELNGGTYKLEDSEVELWVDRRIVLRHDDDEGSEKIICTGDNPHLKEARFALSENKQVTECRLRLVIEDNEYSFILDSEWLNLKSLKAPKVMQDKDDDPDGIFYERMFLIEQAISAVDAIYTQFIDLRTSPEWDESAKPRLLEWINKITKTS